VVILKNFIAGSVMLEINAITAQIEDLSVRVEALRGYL
jgi:hypothetical protein